MTDSLERVIGAIRAQYAGIVAQHAGKRRGDGIAMYAWQVNTKIQVKGISTLSLLLLAKEFAKEIITSALMLLSRSSSSKAVLGLRRTVEKATHPASVTLEL